MSTDERIATKEGMVWQLYEWQQRQQFRHGSPTAPIYAGPNFTDSASFRVTMEMPRSISVPPSPCDVPPSVPCSFKPLSPRRPHTPSERRSVKPLEEMLPGDSTRSSSPSHICAHITQVGHWNPSHPVRGRGSHQLGTVVHRVVGVISLCSFSPLTGLQTTNSHLFVPLVWFCENYILELKQL